MERGVRHNEYVRLTAASILGIIAWALFILVYALAWSGSYTLFQNIVVTIVSLIIAGLIIGLLWVLWGPADQWKHK